MSQIIENIEAHYETVKVPFGRIYDWHPAHLVLQCDCGETLTFSATTTSAACSCHRCGADYGASVHHLHYREEHPKDEDVHPWHHDRQSRADQHLRDEAACPEDSPWRYNDVRYRSLQEEQQDDVQ